MPGRPDAGLQPLGASVPQRCASQKPACRFAARRAGRDRHSSEKRDHGVTARPQRWLTWCAKRVAAERVGRTLATPPISSVLFLSRSVPRTICNVRRSANHTRGTHGWRGARAVPTRSEDILGRRGLVVGQGSEACRYCGTRGTAFCARRFTECHSFADAKPSAIAMRVARNSR